MTKTLLLCLFCIFPFVVFSQDQTKVVKDFEGKVFDMQSSIILDDQVNVTLIRKTVESFELVALNRNSNVLWKVTLKGIPLGFGKFKNNVVAIAVPDNTQAKGYSNVNVGYMVDAKSGNILISKEIFHGSDKFQENPSVYFDKSGSICLLALNQNAVARKFMTMSRTIANQHLTQDLTIVSFNEKLEPTLIIKPAITGDAFIGVACNKDHDIFIAWLKNKSIVNVVKYDSGKTEASGQLSQNLNTNTLLEKDYPEEDFSIISSSSNSAICTSLRPATGDVSQLSLIKFDFKNNSHIFSSDNFDKGLFKNVEKSFNEEKADYPPPNLSYPAGLSIKFAEEYNGKFIIGLSSKQHSYSAHTTSTTESSLLISCYNDDLKPVFKQVFPSGSGGFESLTTGHYLTTGYMYAIANLMSKPFVLNALFGKLNLQTGKWEFIKLLSKKELGIGTPCAADCTLWYRDQFIVPYLSYHGFTNNSRNIDLQENKF